LKFKSADVFPL